MDRKAGQRSEPGIRSMGQETPIINYNKPKHQLIAKWIALLIPAIPIITTFILLSVSAFGHESSFISQSCPCMHQPPCHQHVPTAPLYHLLTILLLITKGTLTGRLQPRLSVIVTCSMRPVYNFMYQLLSPYNQQLI